MRYQRSSGVLLHISSLPSHGGIGDFGPEAYKFLDFLATAKQHIWQVLPLCPTGYGSSPYSASSAFAGNPLLISIEYLSDWGWISGDRIANLAGGSGNVDFGELHHRKLPLLYEAAKNFLEKGATEERFAGQWQRFNTFCFQETSWLNDYACYAVLRNKYNTGAWDTWPEPIRRREPTALAEIAAQLGAELALEQVLQFAFEEQWRALRQAAAKKKIRFLGDIAIFVSMDSADVWANRACFNWTKTSGPSRLPEFLPTIFHPPANAGEIRFTVGTSWQRPVMGGGFSVSAVASCSTTSSA